MNFPDQIKSELWMKYLAQGIEIYLINLKVCWASWPQWRGQRTNLLSLYWPYSSLIIEHLIIQEKKIVFESKIHGANQSGSLTVSHCQPQRNVMLFFMSIYGICFLTKTSVWVICVCSKPGEKKKLQTDRKQSVLKSENETYFL